MVGDELGHFVEAQSQIYTRVIDELSNGRKQSHWMWFVFPQIAGLGNSAMAQRYAISDLDHARRYLAHPVLGDRLRDAVRLMLRHRGKTALAILGSPDDLKFRSCVTLFRAAATSELDNNLFVAALNQFYNGIPDERTLQILREKRR